MKNNSHKPVHRTLILQGGGALGAYEVVKINKICANFCKIMYFQNLFPE